MEGGGGGVEEVMREFDCEAEQADTQMCQDEALESVAKGDTVLNNGHRDRSKAMREDSRASQ